MKQGWEIKKLGDVCTIKGRIGFRGYTRNDLVEQGKGAITLSPSNIVNDRLDLTKCQYISWHKYEESPEIMIYEGDIIFAKTASIGKVAVVKDLPEKATINPQFVVFKEIQCSNNFLYYVLRGKNFIEQIKSITNGVAIPTVSQNNLAKLTIPIPPIAEQEKIVAELDCLSGIIEKKKQQLKEYDAHAQSIFYEMFGDPVENEKGWETDNLKNSVIEMFLGPFGSALKTECYVEKNDSFCMVYEQKHAIRKTLNIETHYINKDKFESLKRFEVHSGDFIMSCRGTIGEIYRLPNNAPMGIIHPSLMKIRIKEDRYNPIFFVRLLSSIIKNENTSGNCVQMAITAKELGLRKPILPPLSLQQSFASKIEAIEKQKALIKKSIEEVETLFNSRMEYYFN